jgi:serine O-acetyltransferase
MPVRNERLHDRLHEFTQRLTATYDQGPLPGHNLEPPHVLPSRRAVIGILHRLFEAFFPGFLGKQFLTRANVEFQIGALLDEVGEELCDQIFAAVRHEGLAISEDRDRCQAFAEEAAIDLLERLPEVRRLLILDVQAAYDGDPAAKNYHEVIFSYPGLAAIATYRVAHVLEARGVPLLPRIMTEWAHSRTGIDIHPGATIGERFFIDHGTGVVVGETTIIGRNVKLYQGVTLGALSFPKDERGKLIRGLRRHPQICDDVVIYGGATILGDITIGEGAVIGGNVWLTESVPPHTKVVNDPQIPRFRAGSGAAGRRTGETPPSTEPPAHPERKEQDDGTDS